MKVKQIILSTAAIWAVLMLTNQTVQAQTCDSTGVGKGRRAIAFVDANGDGFNDNASDHDGDGIPNRQDPDFIRGAAGRGHGFIDVDGDGINDRMQDFDGDGIPNGKDPDYVRPQDGSGRKLGRSGSALGQSGFGRGGYGTGTCTGTGNQSLNKNIGGHRGR